MRTVLTIGREPDNDLVIDLPVVSGHHARVTWMGEPGSAIIEDLNSSNGTAIGRLDRKITRSNIAASDTVYFGNHPVQARELLSWVDPSLAPDLYFQGAEMTVGRAPNCQRVIDHVTISARHAVLKREGGRIMLEDLGSSNGTFVNGRPVTSPTEVREGDLIGLGADSFRLTTTRALVAGTRKLDKVRDAAPGETKAWPSGVATPRAYPATLLALLSQAPVLALLIGLASPGPATALFLLSLAAVWFGLSTAVFGLQLDPGWDRGRHDQMFWLARWARVWGLGLGECLLAGSVAYSLGGLKGFGAPAVVLLILATGVGVGVGSLIVLLARRPAVAWSACAAVVLALGLFGGGPWSLPRSIPAVRLMANAAPSRWAFEGLLISESDLRPSPPADGVPGAARDLVESYFPARSDRMGSRADAMALASMMVGLFVLALFLVNVNASGDGR